MIICEKAKSQERHRLRMGLITGLNVKSFCVTGTLPRPFKTRLFLPFKRYVYLQNLKPLQLFMDADMTDKMSWTVSLTCCKRKHEIFSITRCDYSLWLWRKGGKSPDVTTTFAMHVFMCKSALLLDQSLSLSGLVSYIG